MTATLTFDSANETPSKSAMIFVGKSTRPMIPRGVHTECPRRLCPRWLCSSGFYPDSGIQEDCEVTKNMKKEAKHRAISNYFNGVYGYTDTTDITVDKLYRPSQLT